MAAAAKITQWLNKDFPKPRVDSEWLEGCSQWLEEDQHISPVTALPEFMERVKIQLLESDLMDSMSHGTGLDANTPMMTGHLRGPPVLVQITAITEVGSSAIQLEQVRVAREERMQAGVGDVEGEEDGDVEVEGEGPMPKYPRGTLCFRLSDGATSIEAIEYRTIPQLSLGATPLGYKLQLKGTRIHKGMAMLEPATVILLGGKQAELEVNQLHDLKNSLRVRLGRPMSPLRDGAVAHVEERVEPAAAVIRSPLHDISPPPAPAFPQHNDDIDMEPRRRLPEASSLNATTTTGRGDKQNRPMAGLPSRHGRTSTGGTSDSGSLVTSSPYFSLNSGSSSLNTTETRANTAAQDLDFNLQSTWRQMQPTLPSPPHEPPNVSFDFDLLNDLEVENQPPTPDDKGKGREKSPSMIMDDLGSDEYDLDDGNDFTDPAFLANIDKLERAALQRGTSVVPTNNPPSPGSLPIFGNNATFGVSLPTSAGVRGSSVTNSRAASLAKIDDDVIEIDDSDDEILEAEDKENAPVPTRHIRRRIETDRHPQTQSRSQRSRPVILATNPEDIIDLSD